MDFLLYGICLFNYTCIEEWHKQNKNYYSVITVDSWKVFAAIKMYTWVHYYFILNCTQEIQLNIHMLLHQLRKWLEVKRETFTPLKIQLQILMPWQLILGIRYSWKIFKLIKSFNWQICLYIFIWHVFV